MTQVALYDLSSIHIVQPNVQLNVGKIQNKGTQKGNKL